MLRWLKDRKKPRKADGKGEDEYGFQQTTESSVQNEYGFHNCLNVNVQRIKENTPVNHNDPSFHIYEEILDLPEHAQFDNVNKLQHLDKIPVIGSTNGAFRPTESNLNFRRLHTHSSHVNHIQCSSKPPAQEGPYMVVPIVNNNRLEKENGSHCLKCETTMNSDKMCSSCRFRRRLKSEPCYSEPWDSSESTCSGHMSKNNNNVVKKSKFRNRRTESIGAYVTSSSSECSSGSVGSSSASRSDVDGNDTGYEYDMSTSSESDAAEYRSVLEKVQQNLLLKEQVRNIIHSLSNTDNVNTSGDSSNTCTLERSDAETVRTASSLSGRSSIPTVGGSEVSDPDMPADQSESDDSSGYYEYTETKNEAENSPCSSTDANVQSSKDSDSDTKYSLNKHKKHRSHRERSKVKRSCDTSKGKSNNVAIVEDTEMYLLPASKKDSDCENVRVYRKPLLPPQQTLIYQDPHRSKTGSGNKLLCDLIRMNYDKQHMIHV